MPAIPQWMLELTEEDYSFIKSFIFSSGSLKEMACIYNVTYPTVRLKLDRLIQKIRLSDSRQPDDFIALIKRMTIEDRLEYDTAKTIIKEYKRVKKEAKQ